MIQFLKSIDKKFYVFTAIWAFVQIILVVILYNAPLGSDQTGYVTHAMQNCNLGTFYPSQANLYDIYVQAPGFVNFLIPIYAIFGNVRAYMFVAVFLNVAILFELLYVGFKLFNHRIAYIAAVTYALVLSNIFAPTQVLVEVVHLFFCMTGLCLSFNRKLWPQVLAGVIYAIAYTMRQSVLIFVVVSLLIYIIQRKYWLGRIFANIAAFLIPLFILASVNLHRVNYPVVTSLTYGYGKVMLARALQINSPFPQNGMFFDEDNSYHKDAFSHMTFYERNDKWVKEGNKVVENYRLRNIMLIPKRFVIMWNKDTWCVPSFFGNVDNPVYAINTHQRQAYINYQLIKMAESIVYYIVFLLFVISLIRNRSQLFTIKGIPLIIIFGGTGVICLGMVESRYHYPYVWIMCLWAAMEVDRILSKYKLKRNNAKYQ